MSNSVAVIIPCYNYGRFLADCLESVLAQTAKPAEVLVVDDGSTDNTHEVCKRYKSVRYIWKENGGVSSARNLGLKKSSAEYVMFLDADDVLRPEGLEILWGAKQKAGSEVAAIFGRAERFSGSHQKPDTVPVYSPIPEDVTPYVCQQVSSSVAVLSRNILQRLVEDNIVPQCCALIVRSAYEKVGLWDKNFRFCQDQDMWLRIASLCKIAYVDQTVADIRRHDENITHRKNWLPNNLEILEILNKTAHADWADPKLRRAARLRCASGAYTVGQVLADQGHFFAAARQMRFSLRRNPLRLKPWVRLAEYTIRGMLQKVGVSGPES